MERVTLEQLLMATGYAERHGESIFLVDPHWTTTQRAQFDQICATKIKATDSHMGWLCIPTGGSSGTVRFARHDEVTLSAAVQGFCEHFNETQINVVDVLPPWHVSGLLARVRSAMTGGRYLAWDWKRLEGGESPALTENAPWMISLVPTQLQRLLAQPAAVNWLRRFKLIILGGGPIWTSLAEAAQEENLPIVLSYGMTETAAMITAQQPGEFAAGDRSSGHPLPHALVEIQKDSSVQLARAETMGIVCISGTSVMRGYYAATTMTAKFATADLGRIDAEGRLHIRGRRDEIVISGGEKINPREVEVVLRATGRFLDLAVVAMPHAGWGEELVACYLAEAPLVQTEIDELVATLPLSGNQRPKRFHSFSAPDWPRNAQGKLNRAALRMAILAR